MLNILKKINDKQKDFRNNTGITIAFFGDSVTQGCFEVFKDETDSINTVFEQEYAYHRYFSDMLSHLCPTVPINIINAGMSGSTASHSLAMIDEFVIKYKPDMVVVCFGLNDSGAGEEGLNQYLTSLEGIFDKIKAIGSDIIFMTPNMKCTDISCHITDKDIIEVAKSSAENQLNGCFDKYISEAVSLCHRKNVIVCDCYKKWKRMYECGIDITGLLSNKINHPTREMNKLFAYSLIDTIFKEGI